MTGGALIGLNAAIAQAPRAPTSYSPVVITEPFPSIMARMKAAKAGIEKTHNDLLAERYDLSNRPASGVTMSGGKAVQEGVRIKLHSGMTWDRLASTSPDEIRDKALFPKGLYPLPHPNHAEGGMLFPKPEIDEVLKQEQRDLTPLRPGLRLARPSFGRIPRANLSDHPTGPWRRGQGPSGHY
jgi:cytochrome c peroxidase